MVDQEVVPGERQGAYFIQYCRVEVICGSVEKGSVDSVDPRMLVLSALALSMCPAVVSWVAAFVTGLEDRDTFLHST